MERRLASGPTNPWLPLRPPQDDETGESRPTQVVRTGPTGPQRGVPAPDQVDQLPVVPVIRSAALWVVGAHGGAGARSIASLVADWASAGRTWPVSTDEQTHVVVAARTDARGLRA